MRGGGGDPNRQLVFNPVFYYPAGDAGRARAAFYFLPIKSWPTDNSAKIKSQCRLSLGLDVGGGGGA